MPNRIIQGFQNALHYLEEGLSVVVDSLNPQSENFILKNLSSFFGNVISALSSLGSTIGGFFESLWNNYLKGAFESIGNWFNNLWSALQDIFSAIGNFFAELFLKLAAWFSDLTSSIGQFFSSLWTNTVNFFAGIPEFFRNFWDTITSFFSSMFVPDEQKMYEVHQVVADKFGFVDAIIAGVNSMYNIINNIGVAEGYYIDLPASKYTPMMKIKIIDLTWYQPFKSYGDTILTGFIYIIYLWRLFIHIPNIVHGSGGDMNTIIRNGGND